MRQIRIGPSFQMQAEFYARRFRAPSVATNDQLMDYAMELDRDTAGPDAIADVTREVEAAAARMDGRSEVVILATSILLSAAVVLLSTGSGIRWLELVATLCSLASLYLSLFANLVYVGRQTLGLGPENATPERLAGRLSTKAALSAHAVVLLYPASIALVVSALVT
jgi:hypothetical protein